MTTFTIKRKINSADVTISGRRQIAFFLGLTVIVSLVTADLDEECFFPCKEGEYCDVVTGICSPCSAVCPNYEVTGPDHANSDCALFCPKIYMQKRHALIHPTPISTQPPTTTTTTPVPTTVKIITRDSAASGTPTGTILGVSIPVITVLVVVVVVCLVRKRVSKKNQSKEDDAEKGPLRTNTEIVDETHRKTSVEAGISQNEGSLRVHTEKEGNQHGGHVEKTPLLERADQEQEDPGIASDLPNDGNVHTIIRSEGVSDAEQKKLSSDASQVCKQSSDTDQPKHMDELIQSSFEEETSITEQNLLDREHETILKATNNYITNSRTNLPMQTTSSNANESSMPENISEPEPEHSTCPSIEGQSHETLEPQQLQSSSPTPDSHEVTPQQCTEDDENEKQIETQNSESEVHSELLPDQSCDSMGSTLSSSAFHLSSLPSGIEMSLPNTYDQVPENYSISQLLADWEEYPADGFDLREDEVPLNRTQDACGGREVPRPNPPPPQPRQANALQRDSFNGHHSGNTEMFMYQSDGGTKYNIVSTPSMRNLAAERMHYFQIMDEKDYVAYYVSDRDNIQVVINKGEFNSIEAKADLVRAGIPKEIFVVNTISSQ